MDNVIIKELYRNQDKYCGKEVKVSGWVRTVRDSKTFGFIEINDGSFFKNLQKFSQFNADARYLFIIFIPPIINIDRLAI